MGVPKFFRWLSERYPLINQPIHCPPNEETKKTHGFPPSAFASEGNESDKQGSSDSKRDHRKNTNLPHIMPEFDRLYIDMNGIIHCASHNNSEEEVDKQEQAENGDGKSGDAGPRVFGVPPITEDQIFQNVCYYLDRVVTDIVQPKQVVFLAIDGVAPRAKLNQQRSRRYRSGTEKEIEMHLTTLQRVQEGKEEDMSKESIIEADGGAFDGYRPHSERGGQRFSGTIDAVSSSVSTDEDGVPGFHSNCITPGTPFLHNCSQHILAYIRDKLQTDPKWHDLTIVFSGHDVPGEGEHKILEFIRHEKHKPNYDPNTSHCIFGQDGDLVMLGLAMHEPHTCLLREEVVFDQSKRKAIEKLAKLEHEKQAELGQNEYDIENNRPPLSAAVQSYIHNANFELLHISILREYLGLEFGTKDFYPNSRYELEPTIDDFVFMTFFVGNDFMPHMPALDIGDEAFDLLFYAYKKNRGKWLRDGLYRRSVADHGKNGKKFKTINHPYLTDAGTITSGSRLEGFLEDVGSYEDPYYHNKRESMEDENERMRNADTKAGRESLIPSQDVLDQVEQAEKEMYHDMLLKSAGTGDEKTSVKEGEAQAKEDDSFKPVTSSTVPDATLIKKLGGIFRGSLSPEEGGVAKVDSKNDKVNENSLVDLKGRYYYDKFGFTPFDAEKHRALRKAYITGLVWNLEYYYKGVVSWEWYYPYNYGPMLSDLVNINSVLSEVSFSDGDSEKERNGSRQVAGQPLRPFEQLLGCLPPSSSYLLPEPYRWLMTSPDSPLIDVYPDSFTVDMNGKRWPWEAVTLLPFIDSAKLIEASRSLIDESVLTEEEKRLNEFGKSYVLTRSPNQDDAVKIEALDDSVWAKVKDDSNVAFEPQLNHGVRIPGTSFPTLKDAPVTKLNRRKVFLNVFGLRSRYRTALLEMEDELPAFPPASLLAQKFIGTTVNFRFPILYEGLVCSVADSTTLYRGGAKPQKYSADDQMKRPLLISKMFKDLEVGEGMTGTGGLVLPQADITLTVRPLEAIETLPDGTKVKVYAKSELEIPFVAALFSPSRRDPRLEIPAKLEKNPFIFGGHSQLEKYVPKGQGQVSVSKEKVNLSKLDRLAEKHSKSGAKKMMAAGSARGFATFPTLKSPTGTNGYRLPTKTNPPHRSFHSAANMARRGGPRQRVVGTAGAIAMSAFFFTVCLLQANAARIFSIHKFDKKMKMDKAAPFGLGQALILRGGDIEQRDGFLEPPPTPPVEFAHGTTTLSFVFQGGIVAAVDSRASIGNFVGSKTTQKVLPVSGNILGTMAGGAADCSFWIRLLRSEAKMHELLHEGRGISVARASRLISNVLYQNRGLDLSVGTMIMGYHPRDGFNIYYVDNTGVRIEGDMFAVGSGSTFALGILDTEERRFEMSEEEAVSLGIKAIRHATLRDAGSGGYIGVYLITKDGWRKVFSEDLASIR
eukprot:CAMPEP_0172302378 /NCGR_PEP_ID=MMETSP1058-20130122/4080_1 /TAXON_ID=83371 /ORGANISM="Detonula confervacea, Strain CCMP 353" /LENGTH=1436 /DNA_ID=CAMNT_0013012819 /DNA_START=85 /DNA_END=4395 /DNA_ORIENTATION=-